MPGFDGTGPAGYGPMTGRGMGPCGRGMARGFGRGRRFARFGAVNYSNDVDALKSEEKALEDELQTLRDRISEVEKK